MTPGFRKVATSLVALTVVSACSRPAGPSILGHWHAERVSIYSIQLPVGPDIVVSGTEILNPVTGASVQVTGIESKNGATTVDLPLGVGLTFYFDGPDRVYLKVPLVGRVYYHRVVEQVAASATPSETGEADIPQHASAAVARGSNVSVSSDAADKHEPADNVAASSEDDVSAPHRQLAAAASQGSDASVTGAGSAQYRLALASAGQGNADVAIDQLNEAFKAGFRGFSLLDSAPELKALKQDVRYQALIARYQ